MHPARVSTLHVVIALSVLACTPPDSNPSTGSSGTKSASSSGTTPGAPGSSVAGAPSAASDASASAEERVLQEARSFLPLVLSADEKLIDHMPDDLMADVGGRSKFSEALATSKEQMKTQGFSIEDATVDPPTKMTTNEGRMFAILPSHLTLKTPEGRLRQGSFLVGVSDDDGRNWRFVDGSNPAAVKKLRKFPPSLVLPEPQKPVAF